MQKHPEPRDLDFREGWPREATELRKLVRHYGISRAKAFRWRKLALTHPNEPLLDLIRTGPGRPPLARELLKALRAALRQVSDSVREKWMSSRDGRTGRPQTAMPRAPFEAYRAAAHAAGVTCSDSKIRGVLRELRIQTAGQHGFRKRACNKSRRV